MTQNGPIYFLLVDDREENLLSLEALLRKDGLTLLKARSGPEALELLLQFDVALALMDVQMPGMDGYELAELMRGNARTGAVPIIFLTAGAANSQRRFRGYQAGAVDFINKPIEPDILRSKAEVFFQLKLQKNLLAQQRDALKATAEENARLLAESRQYADALKEVDRRKDEFLATLAHELRNPLAPIINGLRILRMSPEGANLEEVRDIMDRQLTHLTRLIDDLFDVSRISRGRVELRKKRIRLEDALQAAVETSRPLIEDGQHTLTLDFADETLWLEADLTRVAQVVSNLLNNAAKYTPPGGSIILSARRRGDQAVVSVTDTGIGISSEMMPHVFDLFTQVDVDSAKTKGGLGIGLALVRSLVEQHGGSIKVASEGLGAGSVFTVTLPLLPAEEAAQAAEPAPVQPESSAARKILIVDDNVESAKTMGWMLKLKGHDCVSAHTGQEALDTARAAVPDVILLDIGLPDMTGYDVCRAIRQDDRFDRTLLIAQTGWGQQRDIQRGQEAGFDHHLVKPVDLEHLSEILSAPPR